MFLIIEDRPSDSPFVERVWRCHTERAGRFLSVASPHWEMVVTRLRGEVTFTIRGPETKVTEIDCPAEGEWLGVRFKLGTFMPQLPVANLLDRNDVTLPGAARRSFRLNNSAWEYPNFENAETFVARLVAGSISRAGPEPSRRFAAGNGRHERTARPSRPGREILSRRAGATARQSTGPSPPGGLGRPRRSLARGR